MEVVALAARRAAPVVGSDPRFVSRESALGGRVETCSPAHTVPRPWIGRSGRHRTGTPVSSLAGDAAVPAPHGDPPGPPPHPWHSGVPTIRCPLLVGPQQTAGSPDRRPGRRRRVPARRIRTPRPGALQESRTAAIGSGHLRSRSTASRTACRIRRPGVRHRNCPGPPKGGRARGSGRARAVPPRSTTRWSGQISQAHPLL